MNQYKKLIAVLLVLIVGSTSFAQQEKGVVPVVSTDGNETWYFIESAYTGTANVPESLVEKHFVIYSSGGNGLIKYRKSQGTDNELWAIVGTKEAARLKNKATGRMMTLSHSENTTGDQYVHLPIAGSDQHYMYSGGQSKSQVYTNYELNRSGGPSATNANTINAFRFIPSNDPIHHAYINYTAKIGSFEFIPTFSTTIGTQKYQYIHIDLKGIATRHLALLCYDNERQLTLLDSVVFSKNNIANCRVIGNTYEVPIPTNATTFRLKGAEQAAGFPINTTFYWGDDQLPFKYWSDIPYNNTSGWGTMYVDFANGNPLKLGTETFKKGFGLHGPAYVESTGISGYSKFKVNVGKQSTLPGTMGITLKVNGETINDTQTSNGNSNDRWETSLIDATSLRIEISNGSDNSNGNDLSAIGAPCLYLNSTLTPQTLSWTSTASIDGFGEKKIPLNATSTSGEKIYYSIIQGEEYGMIENNSTLVISSIPPAGTIIVRAVQGGNRQYAGVSKECTFTLSTAIEVHENETFAIPANSVVKNLTVYGNKSHAGQVTIPNGLANIEQYNMIYTFTPNEWSYITFPTNGDLNKLSNFTLQGYTYNTGATKSWEIKEFTGTLTNQSPIESMQTLNSPEVKAGKGYLLRINDPLSEPIAVTFTFNNVRLDMSQQSNTFNLQVDLSQLPINGETLVAITPKGVKGNTLIVKVTYDPIPAETPIDYNQAALDARFITFDNDRQLRISLPNRQFANLFILNKKGNKVIRSIKYQSPAAIDISKFKKGTYPVMMQYGDAFIMKELIVR